MCVPQKQNVQIFTIKNYSKTVCLYNFFYLRVTSSGEPINGDESNQLEKKKGGRITNWRKGRESQ